MSESSPTGARRDHGGRRTYQEVVEERRAAVARAEAAEKHALEQEEHAQYLAKLLDEERAGRLHETERYQEALELASGQFEAELKRVSDLVPPGALKFGCAHPYEPFPQNYSGQLVTDGVYWYCTFNHLRVGVLTRAGQS